MKYLANDTQTLTKEGFKDVIDRNWVAETFESENGQLAVTGWLVGDLWIRIVAIQGDRVKLEVGLQHPETKKLLSIQWEGWTTLGQTTHFNNDPKEASFVCAQRVRTGMR